MWLRVSIVACGCLAACGFLACATLGGDYLPPCKCPAVDSDGVSVPDWSKHKFFRIEDCHCRPGCGTAWQPAGPKCGSPLTQQWTPREMPTPVHGPVDTSPHSTYDIPTGPPLGTPPDLLRPAPSAILEDVYTPAPNDPKRPNSVQPQPGQLQQENVQPSQRVLPPPTTTPLDNPFKDEPAKDGSARVPQLPATARVQPALPSDAKPNQIRWRSAAITDELAGDRQAETISSRETSLSSSSRPSYSSDEPARFQADDAAPIESSASHAAHSTPRSRGGESAQMANPLRIRVATADTELSIQNPLRIVNDDARLADNPLRMSVPFAQERRPAEIRTVAEWSETPAEPPRWDRPKVSNPLRSH